MRSPEKHSEHPVIPVVSENIPMGGIKPDMVLRDDTIVEGNFHEKKDLILQELNKHPWFMTLAEDVRTNRKSAILVTFVGGVAIIAAAAAGYEFGIRHGRDIKQLFESKKKKVV